VTDNAAQQRAFDQHLELFSSLDVVCLNAGILENGTSFDCALDPV